MIYMFNKCSSLTSLNLFNFNNNNVNKYKLILRYIEINLNDKKIEYKFKETREYEILIKIKRTLWVIYFLIDLL